MKCPSCGNENRAEARYCDSCGSALAEAPAEAPRATDPADVNAQPPGSPAEVAGRYRITGYLGQGGRKRVYLAADAEADREVAVAIFDTEGATASIGARARREAHAMGKLAGHPHVVDVYDTGEQEGNPYIVSEYMAGGDVEGLLDAETHRRLEVARAIEIATDVARALEHAHGRGIVHRDIKPANVWLAEDGSALLGDFGLATTEGRSRVSEKGTLVGTVAYLPPEQALGHSSGPRSDLYSLGALLYEMLTGRPPFAGDDAVAIISQHINADPLPPSQQNQQVSRALDALVLDLLAKREQDRPAAAADVRERLAAAAGEPPVSEEVEEPGANPLDSLAGGIFVGREPELEQLRGELDEAMGGRGRVVMLVGEPGVGKTRTVEELATYAQVRGAPVHWGRCRDEEGAPAYWPWVQAIRSYVRDADPVALAWHAGAGAADIAQLVPELGERLGGVPEAPELEGEEARFRLFDSVITFLTAAARDRPMMIVLDDLHWADEPSLLLLKFAARELAGSGLFIVGTYRDVELGRHHPLARVLAELGEAEGARRVTLRGLDAPAVSRYMEMASGIEPPAELARKVHEQTEGNPFFVSEVVRLLVSEGTLSKNAAASGTRLAIPQGVREVVGRRLDQLSEEANEALRVAAAIGREFDGRLVMKVADLPYEQLQSAADEAIGARLLVPSGEQRYSFAHALVRETLHDELSSAQRARLHAEIARAIEDIAEGEDDHLGELAHHYLAAGAAGDPERAMDYASLAAGRAMEQHAYEEAAELQERALELFDLDADAEPRRRLQLLLALAEAQASSGQFPLARESLEKAVDAARGVGDTDALVEAAIQLGRVTEVGYADEKIIEVVAEALEALGEGDSAARAGLLSTLSTEELWRDLERGQQLAAEALEMARRVGDPEILPLALHRQLIMEQHPSGSSEERLRLLDEMKEVAERSGAREFMLREHAFRLRELLELGDIAGADREIAAYEKLAREVRMPQYLWRIPLFGALRSLIDGDLEAAERLRTEAQAGGRRAGEPIADQMAGIQLAQLRRMQGRADELLPIFREMTERYPAIPAWRTALAAGLAQVGKVEEARVEFERLAERDFDDIPRDAQFFGAMALITEVCVAVGDTAHAGFLYDALLPVEDKVIVVGPAGTTQGPYARLLGLLAEVQGKRADSERHFERAIELAERMGDRPMLAWTKVDQASVLLGVIGAAVGTGGEPSPADRDRALALLGEAIEVGREIGAAGLVDRALGLRLEAQGLSGVDITTSIDEVISAVESERPDLRAHAAPDGTVTILFSDIEDSTILTERLGDERWLEVLREHNSIFREQIASHDGYEVKNQGDGFMLAFPDPRAALECAINVQRAFAARTAGGAEDAMRVRMGLHAGEVIAEEGDFFGKNVILAARIAGKATGGEILVSSSLKEGVNEVAAGEPSPPIDFDSGRELELKGLAGRHLVFRADWEPQGAAA
ncbi:MAG: protein kinase domain-containing protein [Solirubrobacterales bacterium]